MVILIMLVMVNVAINDADADFDNGSNCKFAIMHNNNHCFQGFSTNWIASNESRGDIAVASWYFPVLIIQCFLNTIWGRVALTYRWKEVNALPSHMTSRLRQQISIGWYNKLRNGNGMSNRDYMCGRPHGQRFWTLTLSSGGDMEIQKACLKFTMLWRLVYVYVTIRLFIVV